MPMPAQPFIAPDGTKQFVPNYKLKGVEVVVWLYASEASYHCSLCHGPLRDVVAATLPAAWAPGPQGFTPAICINPRCNAGGRFIE